MTSRHIVSVAPADEDIRLDRWFRRHYPTLAHGRLEKLLRTGKIRVDGNRAQAGDRVSAGQQIRVPPLVEMPPDAAERMASANPRDEAALRERVIYRDDWAVVLNKPPGLAVQGGTGMQKHVDALLDGLRFGHAERPRLVHRLDRDTSGVLLIARTAAAAAHFTRAFRDKTTRKLYWAVVAGVPNPRQGRIELSLVKGAQAGRERVQVDDDGKEAVTDYAVIDAVGDQAAWLALMPLTGRTHQLRAHCSAIGTPILGDGKYGGGAARLAGLGAEHRLHLHARSLVIPLPDGTTLRVGAPLPPHMRRLWDFLGFAAEAADPFPTSMAA